ncbi:acetylserotonin O-methyltransferase-like [Dipodomys spectabilis]|uniref:acetylserotonin O-methyltransferase-like n=1 Tax=Dipodomys spectabilis TaxID=105255 RepID=UPI001C5396F7|nr:acetylserotonin O-methyltransferase-like [Dipodomys spectabilis]
MERPEEDGIELLHSYAHGFMVSQLGVFDTLAQAPLHAATLAARLGCSLTGTRRLLDACVALRLLSRDASGLYANTDMAATYLTSDGPKSQRDMMLYLAQTPYQLWAHLGHAVREGQNQYLRAFGTPSDDLFAAIYRADEERVAFHRALEATWRLEGRRVLTAFDLSVFPVICDLGGGVGALARACALLYPGSRVSALDAPDVLREARMCGGGGGVRLCAGDFFRDALPRADLFLLARVLHDWPDAACRRLLRRLRAALRPGGAVLLVEAFPPRRAPAARAALLRMLSLNMLLQTRGRERAPRHYRRLLAAAGFPRARLARPHGPDAGVYGAMLATTAAPRPGPPIGSPAEPGPAPAHG